MFLAMILVSAHAHTLSCPYLFMHWPIGRSRGPQYCRRNEPNVHKVEMRDNVERWHGAQLSLIIAGHWQYYRAKVLMHSLPG